ncbi:MAG: YafY family protein [Pseudomonadota bacterium]
MRRATRLFEIIQILRAARTPITAEALATTLEVSARTIYRDIAALQAMRTPIEGEAGLGYVMRRGYDLPPLNFDAEEIEALHVGLLMLARTGDSALRRAAVRVCAKIDALKEDGPALHVAPWGAPEDDPAKGCVAMADLRSAIRDERKLCLLYRDGAGRETCRHVRPIALIYHIDCVLLAAWCELRAAFRHFRTDRMTRCDLLETGFSGEAQLLRRLWAEENGIDRSAWL